MLVLLTFYQIFTKFNSSWRYVPKTLFILASICSSFTPLNLIIFYHSHRSQIYNTLFLVFTHTPNVIISFCFLGQSPKDLSHFPVILINSPLIDLFFFHFPHSVLVFTDGFVSFNSTDFSYFISKLNISFSDRFHPFASSFTAECYAIISVLYFILFISTNDILIASNSQSCLLVILSNPFNSSLSPNY